MTTPHLLSPHPISPASHARPFEGQVFVVTGSTQGLGAAVAHLLAERGAAGLIICGRQQAAGAQQVEVLRALGCEAYFVAADLQRVEDCRAIVAAAEQHFGTLHGLVNCAGLSDRGTILDTSPELFDALMAVNVRAPFFLMQEAIALMMRRGAAGAIVNIHSMCAHGGQPFLAAYSASKGALATLTKSVAFGVMRNRIRVNGINIGWMNTPHEHEVQRRFHDAPADWLAQASTAQPFGRLLEPREVAQAVSFLLSAESGLMTGSVIDMDQGVNGCSDGGPPQPAQAMTLPIQLPD
jgi:NAD(P)-dependent dehydrogenase (short-subunit alcohol dehydrogenase family)